MLLVEVLPRDSALPGGRISNEMHWVNIGRSFLKASPALCKTDAHHGS
jgi:hypothetical protein